jgi:hypothetical protein
VVNKTSSKEVPILPHPYARCTSTGPNIQVGCHGGCPLSCYKRLAFSIHVIRFCPFLFANLAAFPYGTSITHPYTAHPILRALQCCHRMLQKRFPYARMQRTISFKRSRTSSSHPCCIEVMPSVKLLAYIINCTCSALV